MGWADQAISLLQQGEKATIFPRGNSMKGKVANGSKVVLSPLDHDPEPGDVVLVKVSGTIYLHLVKAVSGERYQIGNNFGKINGWVGRNAIYGIATEIEKKE